jgi:plasmid stabilization system protein ParE
LQEEWGALSCQKFLNNIFTKLDKLLEMPSVARFTNQAGIQVYQLDRKNVVFFTVQDDQIVLLSIYPYKKDISRSKYF